MVIYDDETGACYAGRGEEYEVSGLVTVRVRVCFRTSSDSETDDAFGTDLWDALQTAEVEEVVDTGSLEWEIVECDPDI